MRTLVQRRTATHLQLLSCETDSYGSKLTLLGGGVEHCDDYGLDMWRIARGVKTEDEENGWQSRLIYGQGSPRDA